MSRPTWRLLLAALLGVLLAVPSRALSCPGALFFRDVEPLPRGPRQGLRLFALKAKLGVKSWEQVPLQLDPLSGDGRLVFGLAGDFAAQPLQASDLLSFQVEDFGLPLDLAAPPLPCRQALTPVYEVRSDAGVAYLTNCGQAPLTPLGPSRVSFDKGRNTLESPLYRYRFNADNYMQFASIAFRGAEGGWNEVASDSQLLIHADIKNFFTMQFDSHQIESHLEASRLGPIGNLARLSFFLRVLLFKIRMSLATDVGFYADSGHIPMQVDLPVNAYDRLNAGSGILYSWKLASAAGGTPPTLHMPRLDPALVHRGFKELAKLGLTYCHGEDCLFNYSVSVHGQLLSMEMDLQRSLVAKGFFPLFVADTRQPAEAMDWDLDDDGDKNPRIGMYFEVSGLPEGGHPWDFWLRLGGSDLQQRACPRPVALRLLK